MNKNSLSRTSIVIASLVIAAPSCFAAKKAPQVSGPPIPALAQMQSALTQIANNVEPTVVNIQSERAGSEPSFDLIPLPAPPQSYPKSSPKSGEKKSDPLAPAPEKIEATGSGVIVRSDGYILTNDHVVEGALNGTVTVTLSDGQQFQGKVYPDYQSDLAVVKIDPGNTVLPVAAFAASSTVQPGQWAIAIGSPFDLQNTMTLGVISALHRQQTIDGDSPDQARYYPDLIQTDAAINPGNSGGPLFNIYGQVVGINVAIESPVEGSSGVGFAIPSDIAQLIMNDLITQGKVVRGQLGVVPVDLTPALQQMYGQQSGAFLTDVELTGAGGKPSPAAEAGLQAGDIINSFNGKPITDELDLRQAISLTPPGTSVQIGYMRDHVQAQANAIIGAVPPNPLNVMQTAPPPSTAPIKLGLQVRDLTATDISHLSLPTLTHGVLITGAESGSPADLAGLGSSDAVGKLVVQSVEGAPIRDVADFQNAVSHLKAGDSIELTVLSNQNNMLHQSALVFSL